MYIHDPGKYQYGNLNKKGTKLNTYMGCEAGRQLEIKGVDLLMSYLLEGVVIFSPPLQFVFESNPNSAEKNIEASEKSGLQH